MIDADALDKLIEAILRAQSRVEYDRPGRGEMDSEYARTYYAQVVKERDEAVSALKVYVLGGCNETDD